MAKLLDFLLPSRRQPFGGYELIKEIARGGMSRIWKVRHPKTGGIYAMKILTPESVETLDRFRKLFAAEEGPIALSLDHPNVVKTIEYGRTKDDYYIVMEYLDGATLEKLVIVEWPRIRQERFNLLLQVGTGLQYIHSRGLIHRDLCPKNVLHLPDGTTKIIDFGLTIPAALKAKAALARAGTASYMAPEQIRSQPLDVRTDIYGFGVSAFEILTGQRPFPLSADRARRMRDHLNIEPLRLREADPELPEELENLVTKCIAKDRYFRYKSMLDVMKDLQIAVNIAVSRLG